MTSPKPNDAEDAATGEGFAPRGPLSSPTPTEASTIAAPSAPLTFRQAWALSFAWGYVLLVVLGCAAVVFGWRGLKDTLDVRILFR